MNVLLVFDSLFGNTKMVAEAVARGCAGHSVKMLQTKDTSPDDFKGQDLVFVGSPTHGGQPTQATITLIDQLTPTHLNTAKVAAFDTSIPTKGQGFFLKTLIGVIGYAAPKIALKCKEKGADVISEESFFVLGKEGPLQDGELDRATEWARGIIARV